jgi:LDH2 family malate/lactate/ureidoglycolate dehydrogenase
MSVYLKRFRMSLVRPDVKLETVMEAPGTALIDACNSMGAAARYKVMEMAIEKAKYIFTAASGAGHVTQRCRYIRM